ncbi:uL13 family ribosomal protein, partial [Bacillus pumilus]|uniref:uL13 family ribosomal protein n=1 Tax=Bacillus pumilus TaxID=1408 RepID=UPI001642AD12
PANHKPTYTPHLHTPHHVIIINPHKIQLTPNKFTHKIYYPHTIHPRPFKQTTPLHIPTNYPQKIFHLPIKPILPNPPLPPQIFKKLNLYPPSH